MVIVQNGLKGFGPRFKKSKDYRGKDEMNWNETQDVHRSGKQKAKYLTYNTNGILLFTFRKNGEYCLMAAKLTL